ncbi:hypothetical protein GGF46_003733 [Coemansia sp. RSA 552]|nr:hypothetical protein GGF46_003733 [Coemansia sp. RSA 552]
MALFKLGLLFGSGPAELGSALSTVLTTARDLFAGGLAAFIAYTLFYGFFLSPLRHIPGPWYTRLTGVERKYHAWRHKEHFYFLRMFERYGPLVRVGPNKVGVGEVGMFRKLMSSHDMTKSQMYTDFAAVGENIFTTRSPELNRIRRRQIGPAFQLSYVRKMEPLIREEGIDRVCHLFEMQLQAAANKSRAGGRVWATTNLYHSFTMMATDILSSLAYGHRFGALDPLIEKAEAELPLSQQSTPRQSQENSEKTPKQQIGRFEAQETPKTIIDSMVATMMLMGLLAEAPAIARMPPWLLPSGIRRLYSLRDRFMDFARSTVTRYREWMATKQEGARNDILEAYIRARDPETGAVMSDREIAAESTVLLAAGTETTATLMVNCVRLLLRHPDKLTKVHEELAMAFGPSNNDIAYGAAVEKLPYLNAAIYETMRLRASTSGVWPRDAPWGGVTIGGCLIPHGTVICGSIGGVHLNPQTWPQPKAFIPERFLGDDGDARRKDLVIFSAGVRMCPGRHLALMELLLTLAIILRRYEFAATDPTTATLASDDDNDYYAEVDEACHVTTTFLNPDRDCNFRMARRTA